MAEASEANEKSEVYIVYMEKTEESPEKLESKQLDVIASVLGSSEAAKEAVVYHYKHSIHGFSAKLTSTQAAAIGELPGVVQVQKSQTFHLHNTDA